MFSSRSTLPGTTLDPITLILGIVVLNYLLHSHSLNFGASIRIVALSCSGLLLIGNGLLLWSYPSVLEPSTKNGPHRSTPLQESDKATTDTTHNHSTEFEAPPASRSEPRSPWVFDTHFTLLLLAGSLNALGLWFPSYYVQIFAQTHGISEHLSFYSLAVMNIANAVGRIFPNWLGDRWGTLEVYTPALLFTGERSYAQSIRLVKADVLDSRFAVCSPGMFHSAWASALHYIVSKREPALPHIPQANVLTDTATVSSLGQVSHMVMFRAQSTKIRPAQ